MAGIVNKIFAFVLLVALTVVSSSYPSKLDDSPLSQLQKVDDDYRLPSTVVPISYDIRYELVEFQKFTFKGSIIIVVEVKEETQEIVLHHGKLNVIVNSIFDTAGVEIKFDIPLYNAKTEKLTIPMKQKLTVKTQYRVNLSFSGILRDDMIGFYKSSYITKEGVETPLAATQFQTSHARHAFPCFDEPALKAKFKIKILPPDGYTCLGNMPFTMQNKWCFFEETNVPMSTYLVAFIVSDLESLEGSNGKVSVWSKPDTSNQTTYARDFGAKVLQYFEDTFSLTYELPKLDMAAVPDFSAGAMENWGLVTYRESNLLHDAQASSASATQRVATVVAHELAHMWFGNLVTPEWWGYLWLSEGFARYFEYMATGKIEEKWNMEQQFVVAQHQAALGVDSLKDSQPMTRTAKTNDEVGKMGDSITYSKGASIIRMMEHAFGKNVFKAALSDYLNDRKNNVATPDDLWAAIKKQHDIAYPDKLDIAAIMENWTKRAGYPYVKVTVLADSITLSQERFLLQRDNSISDDTVWQIPITWTSPSQNGHGSTRPTLWFKEKQTTGIPNHFKDDAWFIFNVESVGFYRVLYDTDSWNKIIKVLTSGEHEKIHVLNRAAIIDDLLNFAKADLLGYEYALRAIQYLKNETNYFPFKAAFTGLDHLIKKFKGTPEEKVFKDHMKSLFINAYDRLSYNDGENDDQLVMLFRQDLDSRVCDFGHAECISRSRKHFAEWRKSIGKTTVPTNQRSIAYCIAVKYGKTEDWDFLWSQFGKTNVAAEKNTILNALGCTNNTKLLEKYFSIALSSFIESRIHKQDVSTVFSSVYSTSPENAEFVIDFAVKHTDKIYAYHKDYNAIANLISGALGKYPTKKLIDKVERIIESKPPNFDSIIPSLKKSVENAKSELEWFGKYSGTIVNWIKGYKDGESKENTDAYRLPRKVIPSSYNIRLNPYIEPEKFSFTGSVRISADVQEKTDKIVLHSDQLDIDVNQIKVFKLKNSKEVIVPVWDKTYDEKYHFVSIILEKNVEAKTKILIEISYEGYLNTEMKGFYRSSYKLDDETRWLAATHLEPVGARRVFPCFDEPALKATFDISVKVPVGYNAISNMELESKSPDNYWTFKTTPLMSTYLVALVVSDFEPLKSNDENGRTYQVWGNKLVKKDLQYSLDVMQPIVKNFEGKLNVKYELSKMDMVALPDFSSGAMENWGLLTYRETNMQYEPENMSSIADKQSIRNVIAHEIAHQWFGDLVSPLWWDYLWLNEGFARYFQSHIYSEEERGWNLETQFVVDHLQTSMTNDASTNTHPVTTKVYNPTEIKAIFDTISYAKAGSLIRMLEKLLGKEIFYRALNRYLTAGNIGTPEQLFTAFDEEMTASGVNNFNVKKVMESWTTQPGFPVVTATFSYPSSKDGRIKVELKQTRFYLRSPTGESKEATWSIPISYTSQRYANFYATGDDTVLWLNNKKQEFEIKRGMEEWVILNLQQSGYYRVNYDEDMWNFIIRALNSEQHKTIHVVNRAALLDDLFNLARVDLVKYEYAFKALMYLRNEIQYEPWKAALTNLAYLSKRFAGRPEIYDLFRKQLLDLMETQFQRLQFDDKEGEKHNDILLRKLLNEWLCKLEHKQCSEYASKKYADEMTKKELVPPNKRNYVYCTAIKNGKQEDWDYLWGKFTKEVSTTNKLVFINALACSQKPENLKKLLTAAITKDGEVRLQDSKKVFTNVVDRSLVGIETVIDFVDEHYLEMREFFGEDSTTKSIISTLSKQLSTNQLMEKFKKFVPKISKNIPNIAKSIESSLKRANTELNWYAEKGAKIFAWLDKNKQNVDDQNTKYRLPKMVKPEVYDLHLEPSFENGGFKYDGSVTIDVTATQDTFKIVLHYYELSIIKQEAIIDSNKIIDWKYSNDDTHKYTLYFEKLIKSGTKLRLKFEFVGKLRNDMRGFYKSYYLDRNGNQRWLASTQFEPTYTRRAFPCFDEPSFKANFTVHIAKPKGYHTLSNMGPDREESTDEKGRIWDNYATTPRMAPYTLAFVVSDFISVPKNPSIVSVWGREDLKTYLTNASAIGGDTMKILNQFTQMSYPLKQMNLVAVPDFDMGAMENWGLVTFREYGLTYDESAISATYLRYAVTTIAHELVHMWFGNLVTCEWWDYTWLNEGFAEYLSFTVSDQIKPEWELLKQFVVNELQPSLAVDMAESSHPMNNQVFEPNEIQAGFDKIAYQKAGSVLRMFDVSFGRHVFSEALHMYLDERKYDVGRPEHLVAAFKNRVDYYGAAGKPEVDVTTIMNSWITQPGYPVISATRSGENVILSQERFVLSPSSASVKQRVYHVPITYTTASSRRFTDFEPKLWLGADRKNITVPKNDSWFIVNLQQTGFYRVNYDASTWKSLVGVLNSESYTSIDEVNRAQLIDDTWYLARAGYIDYDVAFEASRYLKNETSYLPWKSFFTATAYLSQRLDANPEAKRLYTKHVLALLSDAYAKIGLKAIPVRPEHLDQLKKELLVGQACKLGIEDCVQQSKAFLQKDSNATVPPNIAGAVYCTGIEHGTNDDWVNLWNKYKKSLLVTDGLAMLKGLGCSKNEKTLKQYLDYAIDEKSGIRRQDVATVFSSVYSSSAIGLKTAIEYFGDHLVELRAYYDNWHEVGSLFTSLSSYVSTKEQLEDLKKVKSKESGQEISSSLESAVKSVETNLHWFEKYSPKIHNWLENTYEEKTTKKPGGEDTEESGTSTWIYILIGVLVLIGLCIFIYFLWRCLK